MHFHNWILITNFQLYTFEKTETKNFLIDFIKVTLINNCVSKMKEL